MVSVRPLDQKRILAVAGRHAVVTDRKIEDGGSDIGCTSGELLLLAIGSCATGSVRNFLAAASIPAETLEVTVDFEPAAEGERESIAVTVQLAADILRSRSEAIVNAAKSGRVVSRMLLGSHVAVRCEAVEASRK